jgi:NAD(P)-dependent dehydrogenase (short-subunit alcohol dehydrogenase family)
MTEAKTELAGRVALVTGAGGALGGALTRRLLGAGAAVAAIARAEGRVLAALPRAGAKLSAYGADLADAEAVERTVAAVLDHHGRLDHVFNAAGAFAAAGTVEATPLATWERLLDANFRSTLNVCRAVMPRLREQGGGTIVNVAARAALGAEAGVAAYSVAKTAVLRLTEALAAEGRLDGVRVNCVLPGTLDTPANRRAMPGADVAGWVDLEALVDVLLFLAGPGARAIHGAGIPVHGLG